MRLIDVNSFDEETGEPQMKDFIGSKIPKYAILSHTWGDDEVLFSDIIKGTARDRKAFPKVLNTALQAKRERLKWVWIDTCCIDKSSSAELQEAINSMFKWYERSEVCFAYLEDFETSPGDDHFDENFCASRWFTRGWTLQELLAPRVVYFFRKQWQGLFWITRDKDGPRLDQHDKFVHLVSKASGIRKLYIGNRSKLQTSTVATRMSWAAARLTTREEDQAYSLMGIFDINMPLLYGEGKNAFIRLQEEIIRRSDDMSIFYWHYSVFSESSVSSDTGLLAPGPHHFSNSSGAQTLLPPRPLLSAPFEITNKGLKVEMPLVRIGTDLYFALLECADCDIDRPEHRERPRAPLPNAIVGIVLKRIHERGHQFIRVHPGRVVYINGLEGIRETVFVRHAANTDITVFGHAMDKLLVGYTTLLLSSIHVYGGPEIRQDWRLLGVWQREPSSCAWQDKWNKTPFDGEHSGTSWVETSNPPNLGGWGNGTSGGLPFGEGLQAVAIVLEHAESSLRVGIVIWKLYDPYQKNSQVGWREVETVLNVKAFVLPHENELIWNWFDLEAGIIECEARPSEGLGWKPGHITASLPQWHISGARYTWKSGFGAASLAQNYISGVKAKWNPGRKTASSAQKAILLCYTVELRVPQDPNRVFEKLLRADQRKPLETEGLEKLFEETVQEDSWPKRLAPWSQSSSVKFHIGGRGVS